MCTSTRNLLAQAAEGDAQALRTLLKRHGPDARKSIHGKIPRKWRSLIDEDDVMQVTYMEAFLHLDQLKADNEAAFTAWLASIALNALRDAIKCFERQKRPKPGIRTVQQPDSDSAIALVDQLVGHITTPSNRAARLELNGILDNAIDRLPVDYQHVVRLCDLNGCSVHDVANTMGRSVGAIHMLRTRAHNHLRTILNAESLVFSDLA